MAAWVSLSPRATSVDLTIYCHYLCECGGSRSSTSPPCCSLPLGLAIDSGSLAARSVTRAGSLQLVLFLPWPRGTAERSNGPQLCDTPQAPMAGPAAEWLHGKGHPVLGRAERSNPTCPTPSQLCHALPINRTCSALPSHAPAASQFLWSPEGAASLGAGSLLAAQLGTGGRVVWAAGLLARSFLDTRFILWRTLELSAVQPMSWDQHSPARSGPCHSMPIFRCGTKRLQQEWSPRVI